MQYSDAAFALTKHFEGLRLKAYADPLGFATIGYGHLIKAGENFDGGITEEQAHGLLISDIADACCIVAREVTVPLNQGEFDALVDFVFNLGDRLKGSTLLRLLNAGDYDGAEAELAKWSYMGNKPSVGLKTRRMAEMDLWSKGQAG